MAEEKDRRLYKFMAWANKLSDALEARGAWADPIDPCSGLPTRSTRSGAVYSEVDGIRAVLPYSTFQAGPCLVVSHPRWATSCYPASLFTNATAEQVQEALEEIEWKLPATEIKADEDSE